VRAIIIDDKDARALLERLQLTFFTQGARMSREQPPTLEDMHRWFHFVVCSWLQEQGANVVR
jgi:hypothetical protein